MKRIITWLVVTILSSFVWASPGLAVELQPGREYIPINPPLEGVKGKIEVIEFFSYGCSHCNEFHPAISQWAAALPKDVSFRRVPVSFNRPEWQRLSRIYFAAELTGDLPKVDSAVFAAIHQQRMVFKTDESVTNWIASTGADAKKFSDAMTSFSMQSKVLRADQEATSARISGVPALVVDGKYLIRNEAAANYGDLLKLTDAMIAKVRQDRKGK